MNQQNLKQEFATIMRFLLVGAMNTIVGYGLLFAFSFTSIHYLIYTPICYFIAICFSYIFNAKFTFQKKIRAKTLILFIISSASLVLIVEVVQYISIEILEYHLYLAFLLGMIFYTGIGFFINRFFIFR